jgi:hypothetical protein
MVTTIQSFSLEADTSLAKEISFALIEIKNPISLS